MKTIDGNFIHETAIIADDVHLGIGNHIGPYCVILGPCIIGDNNRLEAFVSIGTPAEHRQTLNNLAYSSDVNKGVEIGNGNHIREFVTINQGTLRATKIGDKNIIMAKSHAGHDVIIGSMNNISPGTILGGHSVVMDYCTIGINTSVHQFAVLGAGCMVGMGSVVTKVSSIQPFTVCYGSPAYVVKENILAIERNNISVEDQKKYHASYSSLINSNRPV